jgi:L-glutamine-phosphate cytidylyltransferase
MKKMSFRNGGRPVKAVILSAGQGRRLLPLTQSEPKCLVQVGRQTVLEWQLEELAACGIREVAVVVGFGEAHVRRTLAARPPSSTVRLVSNPYFRTSDNLVSCWIAREEMASDFLLLNGDTIFEAAVLERLLASEPAPATIAVDHKAAYDADDMKVQCERGRLLAVGKQLPPERTDGEAIGMILFRGEGPALFRGMIESMMNDPGVQGAWYLSAVDRLAKQGHVRTATISPYQWVEVDFLRDLEHASAMVASWADAELPLVAQSAG